jgi:hypothetical protein
VLKQVGNACGKVARRNMFSRRKVQNLFVSCWPGLLAALIIIAPVVRYGPWIPFVDIVAFVSIDSYPPKMSYGPDHYYTFQYTYILAHAISRLLVDFKVSAAFQTSIFYLAQALISFGVIWLLLELLVPKTLLRGFFLILGALALWGGPLAFSLGAALLAGATYLSVRETGQPQRSGNWATAVLAVLAVASHPFAVPFALVLFAVRILFLPHARIQSIGMIVFLFVYRVIIVKENPEADPSDLVSQLFYWYPHHLPTRIANLLTEDFHDVEILFGFRPAALGLYLKFLGLIHLLGFVCSPVAAVIAKDKPALRMLATLNTVVGGLYLFSEENPVVTMWPQRILSFHSCITYVAGVAVPFYLARRYLPGKRASADQPILSQLIKPLLVSLLVVGMLAVEIPILRLGSTVAKNYYHLQRMVLTSGVTEAVLMSSDVKITPWYLRCVPFLLFSDTEVIRRHLLFVTEWHLQGRHPSRIAAVANQGIPHYTADFDMEEGLVSIHLTRIPAVQR